MTRRCFQWLAGSVGGAGASGLRGALPWPVLNQMGKKLLLRCMIHSAKKRQSSSSRSSLPEAPGSKRPKQGCWSKEQAEGTPLPSLEQGSWMWPPQSHSKAASPCKPQEGDKVPSCAVVAMDRPRDVPGWQRTAGPLGDQARLGNQRLLGSPC